MNLGDGQERRQVPNLGYSVKGSWEQSSNLLLVNTLIGS